MKERYPFTLVVLSTVIFMLGGILIYNKLNIQKISLTQGAKENGTVIKEPIQDDLNKIIVEEEKVALEEKTTLEEKPQEVHEAIYTESDVINYFEEVNNEVESATVKEKCKSYFITITDFIFYGTKIKSYTFKELTTSAKLKVLSIALLIDTKIDSKFPNYKEEISATAVKAKEKLVSTYLDITVSVCNKKTDLCTSAKEGFNNLKKYTNITWDFIKNISISSLSKLKDWYEIYSNK